MGGEGVWWSIKICGCHQPTKKAKKRKKWLQCPQLSNWRKSDGDGIQSTAQAADD
jgi:hypothetical protein